MKNRLKKRFLPLSIVTLLLLMGCATQEAEWRVGHASRSEAIVEIYAEGVEGFKKIVTAPDTEADEEANRICQGWGMKGARLIDQRVDKSTKKENAPLVTVDYVKKYQCLE